MPDDALEDVKRHQLWLEENADAISAYNRVYEDRQIFSENLRAF